MGTFHMNLLYKTLLRRMYIVYLYMLLVIIILRRRQRLSVMCNLPDLHIIIVISIQYG